MNLLTELRKPAQAEFGPACSALVGLVGLQFSEERDVFVICSYMPSSSLSPSPLACCWWPIPAFWAFLWFVGFCFLTNQWQASKAEDNPMNEGGDAARAAITFSFFSIFTWVSREAVTSDQASSAAC